MQGDAARDLALAIELSNAASLVGPNLNARDVAQQYGSAALHFDHDLLEVLGTFEIAAAAHHELVLGKLERSAADVHVAVADDLSHLLERNAERPHAAGVDDNIVLLDEAADARHLGDAFGLGQPKTDLPILQRAQIGERLVLAEDGVLVNPADTAGVRAQGGRNPGGQTFGRGVEIFEDSTSGPIDVGAVLEDDVDKRHPEEREPTHHFRSRHR